jgi:hypothetical protein
MLAGPVEVRLTVADQVQDVAGHAGADTLFFFFFAGWDARH